MTTETSANRRFLTRPFFGRPAREVILPMAMPVLAWLLASYATASDPPPLRELVSALGSPIRAEREASEEAIVARGPGILGELSSLARLATGESRLRVERAIARLEVTLVERDLEPSAVSFTASDEPVRDVLDRIAAASGNRLDLSEEVARGDAGARRISLAADRDTFWEAVVEATSKADLAIECAETDRSLRIVDAGEHPVKATPAGPFVAIVRDVEIGRGGDAGTPIRVEIAVAWEPRLRPLVLRLPMESVQVEGPASESIPPANRVAVLEATITPGVRWAPFVVPLLAGGPMPDRFEMLRATPRAWFAAGEHEFDLPIHFDRLDRPLDPAEGATSTTVARATVRLGGVERFGDRFRVAVEVTYDAPSEALASHRMWLVDRQPVLVLPDHGSRDADEAEPILPREQAVTHRTDQGLGITATFAPPPGTANAILRWRLPAALREMPIDIVLRDVPLRAR